MSDFREQFTAYGADYETTMARFMGSEAMYLRLLDMLFRDDNLQKLEAALVSGMLKDAFDAAHTLKGVVGNMGLTPLYQAINTIVEPLRSGQQRDDYLTLLQEIQVEFQKADQFRSILKGSERA